jgi:hypothetical protein
MSDASLAPEENVIPHCHLLEGGPPILQPLGNRLDSNCKPKVPSLLPLCRRRHLSGRDRDNGRQSDWLYSPEDMRLIYAVGQKWFSMEESYSDCY